jgi:proteasome accessory factor A
MQRLHLLFGESNQSEYAYALKVGTTSLVLRLLEDRLVPESILLAQPLYALRDVSRDPTFKWDVLMLDGSVIGAVELQRRYLEMAQRYAGQDAETDWVLREWEIILNELEKDPLSLGDKLDWVAKRSMVEQYRLEEGLEWSDDALHSVDLEYHNIDPEFSLFYGLQEMGETTRFVDELQVIEAMTDAPCNTRALGRSQLVRKVLAKKNHRAYAFDWSGAATDKHTYVDLLDPFETYSGAGD